jgi:hypothetical protein
VGLWRPSSLLRLDARNLGSAPAPFVVSSRYHRSRLRQKVFRLLYNLNIYCLDQNTTYDQYVYATRYGYNLPINRLVPATFPGSLSFQLSWTSHYDIFTTIAPRLSMCGVAGGLTPWNITSTWPLTLWLVTKFKARFLGAHCEKPSFLVSSCVPLLRIHIWTFSLFLERYTQATWRRRQRRRLPALVQI